MKTRGSLLILFVALLRSVWSSAVSRHKGRLNGESCTSYIDCGDSPDSFLMCHRKICQCADFQYYVEKDRMCVSMLEQKCDTEEPKDGLPMVRCGENTECRQVRHDRFGRCSCAPGFLSNREGKCMSGRSSSHHHVNSILPDHPSHQRGDHGGHHEVKQNEDGKVRNDNSFPFFSANTNSKGGHNASSDVCRVSVLLVNFLLSLLVSVHYFQNG